MLVLTLTGGRYGGSFENWESVGVGSEFEVDLVLYKKKKREMRTSSKCERSSRLAAPCPCVLWLPNMREGVVARLLPGCLLLKIHPHSFNSGFRHLLLERIGRVVDGHARHGTSVSSDLGIRGNLGGFLVVVELRVVVVDGCEKKLQQEGKRRRRAHSSPLQHARGH
jgi:hypothetical protein